MTDVWTSEDASKGLCQLEDIGDERPIERVPAGIPPQASDEQELPADIIESELAAYWKDPDRYRSQAGSNLNKLIEHTARQRDKQEPKEDGLRLTPAQIEAMGAHELMTRLLDRWLTKFVPEDRKAEAIAAARALCSR